MFSALPVVRVVVVSLIKAFLNQIIFFLAFFGKYQYESVNKVFLEFTNILSSYFSLKREVLVKIYMQEVKYWML